jgi:DNA polymerase-3 subunit gamma/tau
MSLAREWRRQLYGASTAALIVPFAMLAALVVLALGGGFGQIGVLGQIFSGPPAPGASGAASGGGGVAAFASRSLPVIPPVTTARRPRSSGRVMRAGGAPSSGVSRGTGGAGAAPIVTGTPIRSAPAPTPSSGAPARPAPPASPTPSPAPAPAPQPSPAPQPTAVDKVVTVVTQVTQQVPAPVGLAATQVVQAAGSAADGLLPPAPPGTLP